MSRKNIVRPLCLATLGVGAYDQDAMIAEMCARGPDFLAIDDPFVSHAFGARAQPREVRTRGGFGEQLAPDLLAGGHGRKMALLLLVARKGHQRRPAHALT